MIHINIHSKILNRNHRKRCVSQTMSVIYPEVEIVPKLSRFQNENLISGNKACCAVDLVRSARTSSIYNTAPINESRA